jgi:hypothetical protein
MYREIKNILFVTIFLVALIFSGYTTPEKALAWDPSNNGSNTYTNTTYGFSFDYPQNWSENPWAKNGVVMESYTGVIFKAVSPDPVQVDNLTVYGVPCVVVIETDAYTGNQTAIDNYWTKRNKDRVDQSENITRQFNITTSDGKFTGRYIRTSFDNNNVKLLAQYKGRNYRCFGFAFEPAGTGKTIIVGVIFEPRFYDPIFARDILNTIRGN